MALLAGNHGDVEELLACDRQAMDVAFVVEYLDRPVGDHAADESAEAAVVNLPPGARWGRWRLTDFPTQG